MAVRISARKKRCLAATGWSNSTFYKKISEGKFPKGTKLDPDGRAVTWFEDQLEAFQKAATERQAAEDQAATALPRDRKPAPAEAAENQAAT